MDKLVINGGVPLSGEIRISGAKNAALPILCASLLTGETLQVQNVPHLRDVTTTLSLLGQMGVQVSLDEKGGVSLDASSLHNRVAPYELVKTMRASILVLGPLVARFGEARVSLPGGCAIGLRPVDQHIKGLQAMGAKIDIEHGYIHATAKRLQGARIVMDLVTVTGTENLMMAAALADGTTVLENAAREPEVVDLADCLVAMGATVSGRGHRRHHHKGRIPSARCDLPRHARSDRDRHISGRRRGHRRRDTPEEHAARYPRRRAGQAAGDWRHRRKRTGLAGVARQPESQGVPAFAPHPIPRFQPTCRRSSWRSMRWREGTSTITETVFENRFMHVQELRRLGANIEVEGNTAVVRGVPKLGRRNASWRPTCAPRHAWCWPVWSPAVRR